MPDALSLVAALVWFVVGLCVGAGWAVGHWLVGKVLR